MLFVLLLAQLLLTACEAKAGADKKCHGRGYCAQWLDLSLNPHAFYSDETGEWSCTYGQTAVGEIDCTNETWHETCERVYVSPVTLDRTDSCEPHPDNCNWNKAWKCDCVSEAEAEEGMSLAWMWHFVILPAMGLSLLSCFCAHMKSEPAIDVQGVNAPEPQTDLAQRIQGETDTASSTAPMLQETQPLQPMFSPPEVMVVAVPDGAPTHALMDVEQLLQGGTDTASSTAPVLQETQPLQPVVSPPEVMVVAIPDGAPTRALMDVEQISPVSLALSERDKINQARIAVPTALATRGLQLEQWSKVCDEFDKLLDSNFFVNCPGMEVVYWCCPLGPVQSLLCILNPISCIVCIQPQERAKKECLDACNQILGPVGAAIEIKESMSGGSVHWVPLRSPTAPTAATAPIGEIHSSPLDPGATSIDPGSDTSSETEAKKDDTYGLAACCFCISFWWLVIWSIMVLSRDNDYWDGCEGTQHSQDWIHRHRQPSIWDSFAHTWVENICECAQLILKICSLVWSRYTWCAHQWRVKKRHSASSIDSMLHCLCPVFLKSWLVERQQRNIDGVGEETTMGKGH